MKRGAVLVDVSIDQPHVIKLAERGAPDALASDTGFLAGLNVAGGSVTYEPVALDQGLEAVEPLTALAALARQRPNIGDPRYGIGEVRHDNYRRSAVGRLH